MNEDAQPVPERCELQHRVFTSLGEVRFRRSGQDGLPVMALSLGEREASIPLPSLRREFKIDDTSHDGHMLDLIGTSLDFITVIQNGDTFPLEIRTGEASWRPTSIHLRLASTRLRLDLVAWNNPSSHWAMTKRETPDLLRLSEDAGFAALVPTAAGQGALQLGLSGAHEVLQVANDLSQELAFIEALREQLMARVEKLCRRLARQQMSGPRAELLSQVNRLSQVAGRQIRSRFDEVDAHTGDFGSLLLNIDSERSFIRSNRDWLYRSQRAWQPLLDDWDRIRDEAKTSMAELLGSTYHFLAPRFMPTNEWLSQRGPRRRATAPAHMAW